MAITPTGHIFYEDDYTQKYEVQWTTDNGVVDITTITQQPFIWGQQDQARIENGILYRKGVVTIHRQAIELLNDGYVIIAEGISQFDDFIQMNFPCEQGPVDDFKYHLNCSLVDQVDQKVLEGPHWADPNDPEDLDVVWGDLESDGSPVDELTGTGGLDILHWIDVWSN